MSQCEEIKGTDDKLHQQTIEILNNIGVNPSTANYSKSYTKVYNLLNERYNKKIDVSSYGC